jgi:hypothetical protein
MAFTNEVERDAYFTRLARDINAVEFGTAIAHVRSVQLTPWSEIAEILSDASQIMLAEITKYVGRRCCSIEDVITSIAWQQFFNAAMESSKNRLAQWYRDLHQETGNPALAEEAAYLASPRQMYGDDPPFMVVYRDLVERGCIDR